MRAPGSCQHIQTCADPVSIFLGTVGTGATGTSGCLTSVRATKEPQPEERAAAQLGLERVAQCLASQGMAKSIHKQAVQFAWHFLICDWKDLTTQNLSLLQQVFILGNSSTVLSSFKMSSQGLPDTVNLSSSAEKQT